MTFEFVDLRRGAANRYSWVPPFDELQRYDHDRWWDEVRELDDAPWYVQVLDVKRHGPAIVALRTQHHLQDPGPPGPRHTPQ